MRFNDIYAGKTIGITDLKKVSSLLDHIQEPVAILKRDLVKCYIVPEFFMKKAYELMDDAKLAQTVNERIDRELHLAKKVSLDEI